MTDPRFWLQIHPATVAWWAQRPQCEACAHVQQTIEQTIVLRCRKVRSLAGRHPFAYCIDARDEGSLCGPGATLYEPKKKA
jgi:hypothetical protein